MEPYFQHEGITLYHGDCRDILHQLPMVDCILTDPPYGVSYKSNMARHSVLNAPIENDGNLDALLDAQPLMDAVLKKDSHAYVFASPFKTWETERILLPWNLKSILVWDKASGGMGDLYGSYSPQWEAILFFHKGRRDIKQRLPNVFRYTWSARSDPVHPTVKPVPLLERLIENSTNVGDVVLDPFCGSGTTLAAAMRTGRKAIGIELDGHFANVAKERILSEVANPRFI